MDESHNAIGLRYNITENIDIKAQYDNQVIKQYINSGGPEKSNANIYTLSVDMVF